MTHKNIPHFQGQRKGEKIIVFTRRHWIFMFGSFLFVFFMVLAYFIALGVIFGSTELQFSGPLRLVIITVSGIVLLLAWLFLYIRFIDYYLDVWILTDERIVQIKQSSLFNRQTAGFDLATVQDVAAKQQGMLGTFLNYGTIFVQTAATTELFEFRYIPKPFKLKKQVLDAQDQLERATKKELGALVTKGGPSKKKSQATPVTEDQKKIIKKGFPGIQ